MQSYEFNYTISYVHMYHLNTVKKFLITISSIIIHIRVYTSSYAFFLLFKLLWQSRLARMHFIFRQGTRTLRGQCGKPVIRLLIARCISAMRVAVCGDLFIYRVARKCRFVWQWYRQLDCDAGAAIVSL